MKRFIVVLAYLLLVFNITAVRAEESVREIRAVYDLSLCPECNVYLNAGTYYDVSCFGADAFFRPNNIWARTFELGIKGALGYSLSTLGHEGAGHFTSIYENGYEDAQVIWYPLTPSRSHTLYRTNRDSAAESVRNISMGLAWNNSEADRRLSRVLSRREYIGINDLVWYWVNQGKLPYYVYESRRNGDSASSTEDIAKYADYLSQGDRRISGELRDDCDRGAYWQVLGLFYPSYLIFDYWAAGGRHRTPDFFATTDTELTDAGILYGLNLWSGFPDGLYSFRFGYGINRLDDGSAMYSLELGLADFKAREDISFSYKVGIAKTKAFRWNAMLGLEKKMSENFSLGIEARGGSGYYRDNYLADNDCWARTLVFTNYVF